MMYQCTKLLCLTFTFTDTDFSSFFLIVSKVEYFPLTTENTISQNLRNIKLGNFENNQNPSDSNLRVNN